MVNEEARQNGTAIFNCEFCGSAYRDICDAEACEQHCGAFGYASAELRRRAVRVLKVEIMPLL